MPTLAQQFIYFFAALLLLLNFMMLTQRRMLTLIRLLALQGLILSIDIAFIAYVTHQPELYITVALTLFLKVWLIPFILHRLLIRLGIRSKVESILNLPTTLLIGLALVIFAFNLSFPISQFSISPHADVIALALASVLVTSFMMIVKRKAISQVISLLALENSLLFAACSTTYGMPLVVELGIAFDVLVALFIFGIFFFRIRDTFESFDLRHLEKLREE
jgi:hydrogenase-4 component E